MVEGTITEFKDGGTDLGFEVTLGLRDIGNGTLAATDETASATFGNTNDANGTGTWSAQTYGINAEEDDADDEENKEHSQVALLESSMLIPHIRRLSAHSRQKGSRNSN